MSLYTLVCDHFLIYTLICSYLDIEDIIDLSSICNLISNHVYFLNEYVPICMVHRLPILYNLKSLELSHCNCSNGLIVDFVSISRLINLTRLNFSRANRVNGDFSNWNGFKNLQSLMSLNTLILSCLKIPQEGLLCIGKMINLTYLDLDITKRCRSPITDGLTDQSLLILSNLSNLRFLNLEGSKITNMGLNYLSNLSLLECLKVSHCRNKLALGNLSFLPNLTELSCKSSPSITLCRLLRLSKLKSLDISKCSLEHDVNELRHIGFSSTLTYLNISDLILWNKITNDVILDTVLDLSVLKRLEISEITNDGIQLLLSVLPKLIINSNKDAKTVKPVLGTIFEMNDNNDTDDDA